MNEITLVPAITALCYLFCEAMKTTPLPNKFLPLLACLFGGFAGAVFFLLLPSFFAVGATVGHAVLSGGGSGLLATGAYEAVMQFIRKK